MIILQFVSGVKTFLALNISSTTGLYRYNLHLAPKLWSASPLDFYFFVDFKNSTKMA